VIATGKSLVLIGLAIAVLGLAIWGVSSISGLGGMNLGRLPGDLYIRRGNLTLYFPITTGILLSVIATIVVSLLRR
jgi:hypothetical protein